MSKIKKKINKIRSFIGTHIAWRHVTYQTALKNWLSTKSCETYNLNTIGSFKTSDTIFLLGNGPSLNDLNEEQLKEINKCDSFGIVYSFLKREIVPTYQILVSEDHWNFYHCEQMLAPFRSIYNNVVHFLTTKQIARMIHPRFTPLYFPEQPKICLISQPDAINLTTNRAFKDEDFEKSLLYRNIMSMILDTVVKMNYKKIVLIGVDLDKWAFFYDKYPEMAEYVHRLYNVDRVDMKDKKKFDTMYPKGTKHHTFDIYLYAVADYLKRKRGVTLFIGKNDNMLHPKLPAYFT